MAEVVGRKFQFRAFVSLVVTVSFVAMAFSGAMMFFSPPGRIANWSGWKLLGLTKEQWTAVHLNFSAGFLVSSLIHIWLNGRALLNYLRNRAGNALFFRMEFLVSLLLCGILMWGTLADFALFHPVIALREQAKRMWEDPSRQAPLPHAELVTLAQVAEAADQEETTLRANLEARQIQADWDSELFGEVANRYNLTPMELYNIALGRSEPGHGVWGRGGRGGSGISGGGPGGGYGRLTLQEACKIDNVDLQAALDRLAKVGIAAQSQQTIREIAEAAGLRPSEVIDWIKSE